MSEYLERFSARTHARIMALRLLYQAEVTGRPVAELLADDACTFENEYESLCTATVGTAELPRDCPHYATCDYRCFFEQYGTMHDAYSIDIAQGVAEKQAQIDELIENVSQHWHLMRMPIVDRNIVRMATWEILRDSPEVPASVAIHEAVNIAKEYGGEDSSRFINGVLGEIYKSTVKKGAEHGVG